MLLRLSRGDRVTVIPPITRKWLQHHGYITVQRESQMSHKLIIQITDLGREVMTSAVRVQKS